MGRRRRPAPRFLERQGCSLPQQEHLRIELHVLGRQQLVVTLTSSVPSLVKRGATFELTGVRATVTIPGALVDTLMSERRSLDWTIDHWQFTGSGVRPSRYEARPSLRLGPTSLLTDAIGAITSSKTTTLGPFRAVRGGSATITPSTLELTTWLGHLRCTRSSSSAVSSVVVTVTGKHSSTPTPVGGDLGALGAAALLGGAFAWRQRKHPLSRTRSAS